MFGKTQGNYPSSETTNRSTKPWLLYLIAGGFGLSSLGGNIGEGPIDGVQVSDGFANSKGEPLPRQGVILGLVESVVERRRMAISSDPGKFRPPPTFDISIRTEHGRLINFPGLSNSSYQVGTPVRIRYSVDAETRRRTSYIDILPSEPKVTQTNPLKDLTAPQGSWRGARE